MTDIDSFLAHYGVKGMRWGVRRSESGGGLSEKNKKILTASAIAVGSTSAVIGAIVLSNYLKRPVPVADLNRRSIESGEKVVSNLIASASKRPAFSVGANGVAKALNPDTVKEAAKLQKRVKDMDLNKSLNFLRNQDNVALRVGTDRFRSEKFTELFDNPNLSFAEASKRFGEVNKLLNESLQNFDQRRF